MPIANSSWPHRLLCFFFLDLPILSCQLPICHLFSQWWKNAFSQFLFYAKICTYLTENILFLCCKIPFNFCQIFRGKVLKSPYLAQIFCGWSPTHLSHEPYFQGFFSPTAPVLWYKRIGNFFPIISKVSWIYNMH
jgi:hypothetical protein